MYFPNISGKWLGNRQIRCNWAAKGATSGDEKQSSDFKSVVELTNGTSGEFISKFYGYTMWLHVFRSCKMFFGIYFQGFSGHEVKLF